MSSQRRQTRLTFTPLLSSSPAAKAKAYPAQIQQRVPAVHPDEFSGPTRKGRITNNSPITSYLSPDCGHASQGRRLRSGNISLPTPVSSSQTGPGKSQGRQGITPNIKTCLHCEAVGIAKCYHFHRIPHLSQRPSVLYPQRLLDVLRESVRTKQNTKAHQRFLEDPEPKLHHLK